MRNNVVAIVFCFLLAFLLIGGSAHADVFQLEVGAEHLLAAYSPVYINNALIGYTDKFGRIAIDLPRGTYNAYVIFGVKLEFTLTIDGATNLKTVRL